jgi:hypothetical protein
MAAAIGASRRAIAKEMIDWQRRAIVQRAGRYYRVTDVGALRAMSDPRRIALTYSVGVR